MIALTQEKREELINRCRKFASINAKRGFIGVAEEECDLIHRIALASLTAEPVGYTWNRGVHCELLGVDLNDDTPIGVDLFTAPPVPEIKLPPEFNESHDSFNEFRRGWNGAISEVKRINELGE